MTRLIQLLTAAISACIATGAAAQNPPSRPEIERQVIEAASHYAQAVACPGLRSSAWRIAALTPWTTPDDRLNARYAVLWTGDIGCAGGSGTDSANVSIVVIRAGASFLVDPQQSSPLVRFDSPVRYVDRIVEHGRDTLTLEGLAHAPNDPNCCPTQRLRFTLKVDADGHWRRVGDPDQASAPASTAPTPMPAPASRP